MRLTWVWTPVAGENFVVYRGFCSHSLDPGTRSPQSRLRRCPPALAPRQRALRQDEVWGRQHTASGPKKVLVDLAPCRLRGHTCENKRFTYDDEPRYCKQGLYVSDILQPFLPAWLPRPGENPNTTADLGECRGSLLGEHHCSSCARHGFRLFYWLLFFSWQASERRSRQQRERWVTERTVICV